VAPGSQLETEIALIIFSTCHRYPDPGSCACFAVGPRHPHGSGLLRAAFISLRGNTAIGCAGAGPFWADVRGARHARCVSVVLKKGKTPGEIRFLENRLAQRRHERQCGNNLSLVRRAAGSTVFLPTCAVSPNHRCRGNREVAICPAAAVTGERLETFSTIGARDIEHGQPLPWGVADLGQEVRRQPYKYIALM